MASVMHVLVSRVAEELSEEEMQWALYLLRDYAQGARTLWDALFAACGRESSMYALLGEMLYRLQRIDVARAHMGLSRTFMAGLADAGVVPPLRAAMIYAHFRLSSEELHDMWFLMRDELGNVHCNGSFLDLVCDMEAAGIISTQDVSTLYRTLLAVGRRDIATVFRGFCPRYLWVRLTSAAA